MCEGGHFAMFPTACAHIFGIHNGGLIYAVMFFSIPPSTLLSFFIVEFGNLPSLEPVFIFASCLTFLNLILLYSFDDSEIIPQDDSQAKRTIIEMN